MTQPYQELDPCSFRNHIQLNRPTPEANTPAWGWVAISPVRHTLPLPVLWLFLVPLPSLTFFLQLQPGRSAPACAAHQDYQSPQHQ